MANVAEHHEIKFKNEIDPEYRSPPMFRAELMGDFYRLAHERSQGSGRRGHHSRGRARRATAGTAVRLEGIQEWRSTSRTQKKWFKAFESTTVKVDPVLGQGMGMGLGITRDLLAEIGATVSFVKPRERLSDSHRASVSWRGNVTKTQTLPLVLHVDDSPDDLHTWRDAVNASGVVWLKLRHPQQVTAEDLKQARVVLVDVRLESWPERDALPALSLQPANGLALLAILQEHAYENSKERPRAFLLCIPQLG